MKELKKTKNMEPEKSKSIDSETSHANSSTGPYTEVLNGR